MVIVKLKGGIGNQLFQFAFGRAIALYKRDQLYLDLTFLTENPMNFVPRQFKLEQLKQYFIADSEMFEEFNYHYANGSVVYIGDDFPRFLILDVLNDQDTKAIVLDGYYQDEFYFLGFQNRIKKEFREFLQTYLSCGQLTDFIKRNNEAIAIHIRRGDYLLPATLKFHGICNAEYYQHAMTMMQSSHINAQYYLFSDDEEEAEKICSGRATSVINVSAHIKNGGMQDKDLTELALMTQCNHFILANSSFSWWGSYLSEAPNKLVIAPKKWYQDEQMEQSAEDIALDSWIRI